MVQRLESDVLSAETCVLVKPAPPLGQPIIGAGDLPQASLPGVRSFERFAEARIFIVDDNPVNVALLVALLGRAGFRQLFTETDSRLVQGRLADVDPDLVVLDLHMPYLDGFQVLQQIREVHGSESLPVLVLTADSNPRTCERALNSGAQDYVSKPFLNGEVLARTRNLLNTRFAYSTLRNSQLQERQLASALSAEQDTVERLEQLDDLKDTLLQSVSHDLRNPISAVLVLTTILAADASGSQPLTAEVRSALIAKVRLSALRMERLLKDILDSDPMRHTAEQVAPCDVGAVLRRVLGEADLSDDHPIATDIASVEAIVDPAHLERIVENLLSNARQHVPSGVPIWVSAKVDPDGVLISVDDAGPGITPEVAARIFEPFRRGANSAPGGLGLGLSLVSRFAKLHGGRAWVEERRGGGASFRVILPAAPVATVPAPSPVKIASKSKVLPSTTLSMCEAAHEGVRSHLTVLRRADRSGGEIRVKLLRRAGDEVHRLCAGV